MARGFPLHVYPARLNKNKKQKTTDSKSDPQTCSSASLVKNEENQNDAD